MRPTLARPAAPAIAPFALSTVAAALAALLLAGCPAKDKCPGGQTDCGGTCFDLQTSEITCGSCDTVCAVGATCVAGACQCPAGQVVCGAACVDPRSDAFHCGACTISCGLGTCVSGACACDVAASNATCTGPGDQCVNTQDDTGNCGACRAACPTNEPCVNGTCQCLAPNLACPVAGGGPDACVLAQTDERNCGACGNRCATGQTCTAGVCACPAGQEVCGAGAAAACTRTSTDPRNCGACGTACPLSNDVCVAGACRCPAALPVACGGVCVACPTGGTCGAGGTCACPAGPSAGCSGGATKACCAGGTTCCGDGSCPVAHSNGLGQTFFDCSPLGQHSRTQALRAADAWDSRTGTTTLDGVLQCPFCVCRVDPGLTRAAVWCYEGSVLSGLVGIPPLPSASCDAACPFPGAPGSGLWN